MHDMKSQSGERARRGRAPSRAAPSWDDIRFFLAIYRAGSLSGAAGPLGVTQPTCGRRLAALEASLGLRLFDRTPDGLKVTSRGKALLEMATRMEQSAEDLALRATVSDRDLEGVIRIATSDLFATSFLVGALRELRKEYPGIRAELAISNTETDLLRREADIAFRFGAEGSRPKRASLIARRLGEEPFLLYGADEYLERRNAPADPNDLFDHDVVAYAGPHPAVDWCARAFERATVVLSAPSMQVIGAAIAAGLGLGVLPKRAARLFPSLRPLSPAIARATGWMIVHPDLRQVPRIRVAVDMLTASYRADPTLG